MTGTQFIDGALGILQTLKPGASANASQAARYLLLLNQVCAEYEAEGRAGFTLAGRVLTVTAVAAFGTNPATDNTYPSGWEAAIMYRLSFKIAGTEGAGEMLSDLAGQAAMFENKMLTIAAFKPKAA
jgi:hypothetical protein